MLHRFLVALSAFTITLPAAAHSLPPQSEALLTDLQALGGRAYVDSEICKGRGAYGVAQGHIVHICLSNHQLNDVEEVRDTVRHEVWHVIQACAGGPLMLDSDAEIEEAQTTGWEPLAYDPEIWAFEAEAHNAAHNYTEAEISGFMHAYCH